MIEVYDLDDYKKKIAYFEKEEQVGYIVIEDVLGFINIIDVLVLEDYRRLGIATKMFNYVFESFKNEDVKFMLEVREDNYPAINLYKKLNFVDIHHRKKYYKTCDAIIMERVI